jgi:hypothetical protein
MVRRAVLLTALLWSVVAFAASVRTLVAEDGVDAVDMRHAIRHAIEESSEWGGEDVLSYFEDQWRGLNNATLGHAATAVILGVLSVWGLMRSSNSGASVS